MNANKASTVHLRTGATFLTTFLAASLFLTGAGKAAEAYDADKFGPEEPIVWTTPTKATFTHKTHTMDAGLECDACHDSIFTMEKGAAEKSGNFTMQSFKKKKFCGSCHDGNTAFEASTQCGSCHTPPDSPIVFTSPVKAVSFDHSIHLKKGGLSCEACHKDVFAMKKGAVEEAEQTKVAPQDKRKHLEELHNKYCGTCHDSSQAFGYLTRCTVCHIGVKGVDTHQGDNKKQEKHGEAKH
jgi:c(7)-type cytochrome triheme protein